MGVRFSTPVQAVPGAHPASCTRVTGSGVKSGRCVTLTPHPLLVQWPRKSRAIPLPPPPMCRTACAESHCLYTGTLLHTVLFPRANCCVHLQCPNRNKVPHKLHTTDQSEEDQRDRAPLKRHSAEHPERKQVGMA